MKRILAVATGIVVVMVIIVPGVVALLMGRGQSELAAVKSKLESVMIQVYLHEEDKVVAMPLEEYVKGVVAAEMPAEFEPEALKAQAVAARTYAVKQMRSFGGSGLADRSDADVSTDFHKNQAWANRELLKTRWGAKYEPYWKKVEAAVNATHGQIAVYEDQPISAVFHSTSGAKTVAAKEIWGTDFPYLQSVDCEWDKDSPRYQEKKEFPFADLGKLLGDDSQIVSAAQLGSEVAQILAYTDSGRVKEVKIGSKVFTGQELRTKLSLRSDQFSLAVDKDKLVVSTVGYGHGVGLCQYGANGMAKAGNSYENILKHYYTGIDLKNIYGS